MARRTLLLALSSLMASSAAFTAAAQTLPVAIPNPPDPLMDGLAIPDDAASVGMWSESKSWPLVSIHSALLPDGSVLTFGSPVGQGAQDGRTFVRWNPWTGTTTTTPNSQGVNSFCAAGVLQPTSGQMLISGGNESMSSTLFDYRTGTPNTDPSQLAADRWYATMTMLSDGRTLITGGSFPYAINVWQNPDSTQSLADVSMTPEIYTPGAGWSSLFGANSRTAFGPDFNRWWYPRQWVAPDGNVFGVSSEKWWRLDPTGDGAIIASGNFKTGRDDTTRPNIGPTSTAVMFDIGKVLQVGGNAYTNEHDVVSSERATVFDINSGNPVITDVASMQFRRTWVNSIVLPTGQVVVTGGTQFGDRGDPYANYQAELWDPDTETFSGLASASVIRNYHSTTILLENGAIFSSGGGVPGPVTNFNYEIYYPPYLFTAANGPDTLAPRPQLVSIEGTRFAHGSSFEVELADGSPLSRVALIGLSSTTHSFNMGQRYVPASFAQSGTMLTVEAPSANLAPPGYYLLFAVNDAGIPSRGVIIAIAEGGCSNDTECDDGNDCTLDQCTDGLCSSTNQCTDPVAFYPFEQGGEDAANHGNDATLQGGASIVAGHSGNAVSIDGGAQYVDLPDGIVSQCEDFTFAAWVYLDDNQDWNRIFDFGTGTDVNMFLTPKVGGQNSVRFALKTPSIGAEEQITFDYQFPLATWKHVSVVLEGDQGRLYIDGAEVATATITGNPMEMGATGNNWLGRSNWPDPQMNGRLDDVIVSCRAYTGTEIGALAAPCTTGAECDDGDPCTDDLCADGSCSYADNGSCQPSDDPLATYAFDAGPGATDGSGNGNDGALMGGATLAADGVSSGSVALSGANQYVDLPDGVLASCSDFTFAGWVRLNTKADWSRIFDFGSSTTTNMFLTPKVGGADTVRFAIKVPGINNGFEEQISAPFAFPLGTWTHVAVVLDGDTGTLFIDGTAVATNTIAGDPSALGSTINNWLGRSQYGADPYLNGNLDELWLSCRAYSPQEIAALAAPVSSCGDATCDASEDCSTCPADCGACPETCGNGTCAPSEDCSTCPADCGACPETCGNGTCAPSEDCSSCSADCGVCPNPTLLDVDFASGAAGFTYVDDAFRGTNQPAYASGEVMPGNLRISLGGVNGSAITNMSGGWGSTFELPYNATVDVLVGYALNAALNYEDNECSEVLISVDGQLLWSAGRDYAAQICSGGAQSGTFTATTPLLSAGSHTVLVGGFNNQKTELAELTTIDIDEVLLVAGAPECTSDSDCDDLDPCTDDSCGLGSCASVNNGSCPDTCGDDLCGSGEACDTCPSDCGLCASGASLIDADFENGVQGFLYQDDAFRGTNQPAYASGSRVAGDLTIALGGLDAAAVQNMSGAWGRSFSLSRAATVNIALDYSLTAAPNYEDPECSQVLVAIDGQLVGAAGNDYVVQLCSGGTQSAVFNAAVDLAQGIHTITVGGFNNQKTEQPESTTVAIHSLTVTGPAPECSVDADCDDGDPCTDDSCMADACSHLDNGSCDPEDVATYSMNDAGGSTAADISGHGRNATLVAGATFTAQGLVGGAAELNGTGGYVDLPDAALSACDDFTFAAWVWLDQNPDWNRIFDFGNDTNTNMFLTPKVGGTNALRFALKVPGNNGGAEEQVSFPMTFPLSTWTHVALVLSGNTGTLYVDGSPVASNTLNGNPSDMGATVNNWLGRSNWPDPYMDGRLDDVHISCRAFTDDDIAQLVAGSSDTVSRRSLFETTQAAVSQFTLAETLGFAITNAGLSGDANTVYRQLVDSYASAPGNLASAIHCGDESTNGVPTLNGYPIACDRLEAQQVDNLDQWFATALVNRIDLTPADGAHCGNQRIAFANNAPIGNGRMLLIVEAQVPNPNPVQGRLGCKPIADFWKSLESVSDATERGLRLREAFLNGGGAGFAPFINAFNLTQGTGQIRTNNFNDEDWTLREFKFEISGTSSRIIPGPMGDAPPGVLWNDTVNTPTGEACRANFLTALDGLLTDEPGAMHFVVDEACRDSESLNDFTAQNYPMHLLAGDPNGFQAELATRLQGTGLTPVDIATRARFAGSCIGCHQESRGNTLGNGVAAPSSLSFVHIEERFLEDCADGPCFPISRGLKDVFLPYRKQVLDAFSTMP